MSLFDDQQHVAVIDRVGYNRYRMPHGAPALDPAKLRVTLLTSQAVARQVDHDECFEVFAVDVEDIPTVIEILTVLHRRSPFNRVIAFPESYQLPIAALRERLGIPGPGVAEILPFRDKFAMKRVAAAGGLRVAEHIPIETATDAASLLEAHGKIFLKPRTGSGSKGVYTISSRSELSQLACGSAALSNYQAERYIDAPMIHIDAVVRDGRPEIAVTSIYLASTMSHLSGQPMSSVMVSDPVLRQRAAEHLDAVVKAFSVRNMVLHLESFLAADLIFNEVACRPGGGGITPVVQALTGCNLFESFIRLSLAEPLTMTYPRTAECAGWVLFYGPAATFLSVDDDDIPIEWIIEKKFAALPGEYYKPPGRSGGAFATYVVRGPTESQVRERIAVIQQAVRLRFDSEKPSSAVNLDKRDQIPLTITAGHENDNTQSTAAFS